MHKEHPLLEILHGVENVVETQMEYVMPPMPKFESPAFFGHTLF
jgi:hypothetical protein